MTDRLEEMNRLSGEIQRMSQQWIEYVAQDHHKDRDCHFGIDVVWSYGEPAKFKPWHHGYVGEYWDITCPDMLTALRRLHDHLALMLRSAYRHALEMQGHEDEYWSTLDCEKVLSDLREYMP